MPCTRALLARGAGVVLCAHLGRPGGQPDPRYSLAPVAARLGELLGRPVALAADPAGPAARGAVAALRPGGVVLLENLRFSPAETSKDDAERGAFADRLAELADLYVGDGFGVLHRRHASVYDAPLRLPNAAGYLVVAETSALSRLADDIQRPYVVVLGGAKVADKIEMVDALLERADVLLIGGAMALPFLAAQGHPVGSSALDDSTVAIARGLLERARHGGAEIVLPSDLVAAARKAADSPAQVVPAAAIPPGLMALDIGPESARQFAARLTTARTAFWNGPMGVFELSPFAEGTRALARALIDSGAFTVVGGGDTTAACSPAGLLSWPGAATTTRDRRPSAPAAAALAPGPDVRGRGRYAERRDGRAERLRAG
jgi:phosphoglycerate kinase